MNRKLTVSLIAAFGLGTLAMSAASVVNPDANKYYRIKHASGLYLTDAGFGNKIAAKVEDNTQVFRFIPAGQEGVYNIQRVDSKTFLGSDGKWTSCPIGLNKKLSQHRIVASGEMVTLVNLGMPEGKNCIGTDAVTAGSSIYTDKAGTDAEKHLWSIEETEKYAEAPVPEDFYKDHPLADNDPRANVYDGYRLVFAEEFSGSGKPDPSIWNFETGYKRNEEDQYYYGDNCTYIEDGVLVIEGKNIEDQQVRNPLYQRGSTEKWKKNKYLTWVSGSMQTQGGWQDGYTWMYGIYEVRAKVPQYVGCWPAIWSTGKQYEWPYDGEIDIMEYYGHGIHGNVAWGGTKRWSAVWDSAFVGDAQLGEGWGDNYHTWIMVWDPDHIELWCDDILVNQTDLDQTVNGIPDGDFDHSNGANPYRTVRQMLWLNLALGGINGGSLANTPNPSRFLVDYARIYQKVGTDGKATYHVDSEISEPTFNKKDGDYSAVESIMNDAEDNVVTCVYNMQGIRVADNEKAELPGGIYIVKGTKKSYKIYM